MSEIIINRVIASIILLSNIFWIHASFKIIVTDGGAMGFGYLALPFTLFLNILIIPSILTFWDKYKKSTFILSVNILGLTLILFISWLELFK